MRITISLNQFESEMIRNTIVKSMMTLGRSPMDAINECNKIMSVEQYDVNLIAKVSSNIDGTELVLKTSDKVGSFVTNIVDKIAAFAVDFIQWIKPAVKQATVNSSTLTVVDEQDNELNALYIEDSPEPEMLRECILGDNISRVYINTRAARPDYDFIIPDGVAWEYVYSFDEASERLKEINISQHEAGEKED